MTSLLTAGTAGASIGQQAESPSVTLTNGEIDVDVGEPSTVTTTYEFDVSAVGSGDQRLTDITGSIWKFPGRSVSEFSASVNGDDVSADVTEQERHYEVVVPVEDISSGDTVTVTVTYNVAGPDGDLKVPVFVPDSPTSGESAVVDLQVVLPNGQQVQGDTFPRMDSTDGNVASAELLHVPGFVTLEYGSSGGFGLNTVLSILGIAIILAILGGWVVVQRRRVGASGGGVDVS